MGVPGVRWQCVEPVAARLWRTDLAGAPERCGELSPGEATGCVCCLFDLLLDGLTTSCSTGNFSIWPGSGHTKGRCGLGVEEAGPWHHASFALWAWCFHQEAKGQSICCHERLERGVRKTKLVPSLQLHGHSAWACGGWPGPL